MHWLERHWYRLTPLHLILWPLSLLFAALAALRRGLYRCGVLARSPISVPVILVGNLSVGGSGKTPLTLFLAEQLRLRGWHPGIISRGYGGTASAPQAVTATSPADRVGDEPLLMAQRGLCPVWIGRDRPAAAQALLAAQPECNVILSDDGLQHYRLPRAVEIVVVDGVRRFGNGLLLPAGPLREPLSRLRGVDAVVVNGGVAGAGEWAMQLTGVRCFNLRDPARWRELADFRGQRVHAVAGIGHPERFFTQLEQAGLTLIRHPFPDHHRFTPSDLAFPAGEVVLMTEKDAVKCARFANENCWLLRVEAQLSPDLVTTLLKKITPHGR